MTDTQEERDEIKRRYALGEIRETVDESDLEWWLDIAPTLEWKWAKTMQDFAPHWYCQREVTKKLTLEEYHRAIRVIWTFGTPAKFHRRINIELVSPDGDYKWFTSDGTLDNALINRATLERTYGVQDAPETETKDYTIYDGLSTSYDGRYENPDCEVENREMWRAIATPTLIQDSLPTILDIGAGTGLAMDMKLTKQDPDFYRAIDPSQGMLNRLVKKHPWVTDVHAVTAQDYFDNLPDDPDVPTFDTVLALFGSASYIPPRTLRRLPEYAERMVVMMHYVEGYRPDYHTDETWPEHADASRETALRLLDENRGRTFTLNNFQVVILLNERAQWR